MKKGKSLRKKRSRILSLLTIFLGFMLLIYMIGVEGEPGALPLFLIVTGIGWFIINRWQSKKQMQ